MSEQRDIPRWARGLGEETYFRIVDLIDQGWSASMITDACQVPADKQRSLQRAVKEALELNGKRERLRNFATLKTALLAAVVSVSPEFENLLSQTVKYTVECEDPGKIQRGTEVVLKAIEAVSKLVAPEQQQEAEREAAERGPKVTIDAQQVVADLMEVYGVPQKAKT